MAYSIFFFTTNHIVRLLLNYWQMIYPFSRFKTIELIFILTPLLPYNVVCNRKNNRKRNYVYAKYFLNFWFMESHWKQDEKNIFASHAWTENENKKKKNKRKKGNWKKGIFFREVNFKMYGWLLSINLVKCY